MLAFSSRLNNVIGRVHAAHGQAGFVARDAVAAALRAELDTLDIDAQGRTAPHGSRESLERALGDLSLAEVQRRTWGNDPLHPSPDSLLGTYLRETGATTLIRRFPTHHGSQELGPERLVVSVSAASFPEIKRRLGTLNYMTTVDHAMVVHGGNYWTYSGGKSDWGAVGNSQYKVFSMVMLDSHEGQRMDQYLRARQRYSARGMWNTVIDQPWTIPGYMPARSAYGGCTQHIANIPVGNVRAPSLHYPGAHCRYAEDYDRNRPFEEQNTPREIVVGQNNHDDPMVRRVWKSDAVNQQLAEILGLHDANAVRGDMASPGGVISSILGEADPARIAVVLVARPDHREPIQADFTPVYENPL
jgi:hypothetical protein